jgi:endonuclease-3
MDTAYFTKALDILEKEYPKWQAPVLDLIAVNTHDPFRILISTIISLRTKDQVTTAASKKLYAVADTPEAIAKLPIETIEKLIYPAGFYHNKARQIKTICKILVDTYNSSVPNNMEDLLSFKGVGRKTANLVLALGFNIPAICVDTHVHRITNRLGYIQTSVPEQTEFALREKLPEKYWLRINTLLVAFGQTICQPIRPKCQECKIAFCPSRIA